MPSWWIHPESPGTTTSLSPATTKLQKNTVQEPLEGFGWPATPFIDLGDITGARGAEMYSRLYFTLTGALGTFDLNIKVIRAS